VNAFVDTTVLVGGSETQPSLPVVKLRHSARRQVSRADSSSPSYVPAEAEFVPPGFLVQVVVPATMARNSGPSLCVRVGLLGEPMATLYDALSIGCEVFLRTLDKREVRNAKPTRHWRWNRNGSLKLAPY
jgi:hypothetical protein